MRFIGCSVLLLALLVVPMQNAQAAITTFDTQTTFISTTGATSATGPLPDLGMIPGGAGGPVTIGSITLRSVAPSLDLYVGTAGLSFPDWYAPLAGNDIAISGTENLDIDLASPVFSLGFDFAEPARTMPPFSPSNFPTTDGTFLLTLYNGSANVGSFSFNAPDDVVSFVGLWSDQSFNRVQLRETSGGIDDEYLGQIYTGTSAPTTVPVPSALLLVGFGSGIVGWLRRDRHL